MYPYPYSYAPRLTPARIGILLALAPILMMAGYISILIVPMIVREVVAAVMPTVLAGVVGS